MKLTAEKLKQLIREELENESMLTSEEEPNEDPKELMRQVKSVLALGIANALQGSPRAVSPGDAQMMADKIYPVLLEKGLLKQK